MLLFQYYRSVNIIHSSHGSLSTTRTTVQLVQDFSRVIRIATLMQLRTTFVETAFIMNTISLVKKNACDKY